jgi:hypothetical protein
MTDIIVDQVINKLEERSSIGMAKYQTTLEMNNHDNYMKHLQEELMDAALYLEKIMSLDKELTRLVKKHPNDAELGMVIRRLISRK